MAIRVHLLQHLKSFADGSDIVEVKGSTVGDCLEHLVRQFPGIEKEIFKKKGELSNIFQIYINGESAYPNELAKPVKDGDEIYITLIIGGG